MKPFSFLLVALFTIGCGKDSTPSTNNDVSYDQNTDAGINPKDTSSDFSLDVLSDQSADDMGNNAPDLVADFGDEDVAVDLGDGGVKLREELREAATINHTPLGYRIARDQMYGFGGIEDHDGRIEGIYSGRTVDTDASRTPGNNCKKADGSDFGCSFNTEHTFAQNFLRQYLTDGSSEFLAAQGDIHHLFPSDQDINNARWHFAFANTDCDVRNNCKINEESKLGLPVGEMGSSSCSQAEPEEGEFSCVMQVRDLRKGDVARAQFYMAVRYNMPLPEDSETVMREWNTEDPPDDHEKTRNDLVESVQGNRNPFVDDSSLVDRIQNF